MNNRNQNNENRPVNNLYNWHQRHKEKLIGGITGGLLLFYPRNYSPTTTLEMKQDALYKTSLIFGFLNILLSNEHSYNFMQKLTKIGTSLLILGVCYFIKKSLLESEGNTTQLQPGYNSPSM